MGTWAVWSATLAVAAAQSQTFTVDTSHTKPWVHHWEESVGSGHAALTSRADWRAHLTRCAKELGVKRTRFHGLLDDDFAISLKEGSPDYVNLDSLVDFHLSIGMEPLFEVSFMPAWLAANTSQTVCFYDGITSPPTDYAKWGAVVHDMVAHLHARYGGAGSANRSGFLFEVWNEPNGGFWSPGDRSDAAKLAAYLRLYKATADAIKAASAGEYLVGGPATAGCPPEWLEALIALNQTNGTALDFVSCHAYGGGGDKNSSGNLGGLNTGNLRRHAATVGAGGVPSVLTEWSSSYSYNNGYHDDVASAPFIVLAVAQLGVDVSSYWTFSDVFEEGTLIPTPFHGGFGLLTINGTPKPAYRAFQLLHGTGDVRYNVARQGGGAGSGGGACDTDTGVLATSLGSGGMRLFLTNHPATFNTTGANCTITVDGAGVGPTTAVRHARIDGANANPMAAWVAMGSPTYPSAAQLDALEAASELSWANYPAGLTFDVPANGMVVVDVLGGR